MHNQTKPTHYGMIKYTVLRFVLLSFISFIFLLFFSFFTSPLTNRYGNDQGFFQLVGQGMTDGLLPYRDFFDTKGPYLFLIEYIAQLVVKGRFGIFIVQWINLFVTIFFADRIHRLFITGTRFVVEFFCLIPYLWVAAATFQGGNLSEEFCLPAIMICVYYTISYILNRKDGHHPPRCALVYGAAFGYIALIRINNAAIICAVVFCIVFDLVQKKQFVNLIHNAVMFCCGFILSILPGILYCAANGILCEMIYAVFEFAYIYAAEGGLFEFHINQFLYLVPYFFPVVMVFWTKRNSFEKFITLTCFAAITLCTSIGNAYPHYYTIGIPYLAFGVVFLIEYLQNAQFSFAVIKRVIAVTLLCLISVLPRAAANGGLFLLASLTDNYIDYDAQTIVRSIPESDYDSVYTWEISSKWYLETGIYPCNKYCDWQEHYVDLSPAVREEIQMVFENDAPKYVIISSNNDPDPFFADILTNKYHEYARNDSYRLFIYR